MKIHKLYSSLWFTIENALVFGLISTLIYDGLVCPWLNTPTIFVPYGVCVYWLISMLIHPPQIHFYVNQSDKKNNIQSGLPEASKKIERKFSKQEG